MEKELYRSLLQSVGIETFVEYYNVFKANKKSRSNESIKEAFKKDKKEWKENAINDKASCGTKASKGKKIFQLGEEKEALLYIINEARKIDDSTRKTAKKILNNISLKK